jgi:NNP family nitrate/nitrite transporter-like MFS transporter
MGVAVARERAWSARAVLTLVVLTVGLGLNVRAWILLGPQLHDRFGTEPADHLLLVGLPLLVAALVRLPAGVLTDRYGARVMFPLVSVGAAGSAFALGMAGTVPAAVLAGAAAGVGGAAFVVGATVVARTFPYGRRGLALGTFGAGGVVTVAVSATSRGFDPVGRDAAMVLGVLLLVVAGVTAAVLRDPVPVHRSEASLRRCVELVGLAARTPLTVLYAISLGGLTGIAVFLPVYLATTFGMGWFPALVVTGLMVLLAATARLVGGWWTDHRPTVRLLRLAFLLAAGLCLIVAFAPGRWALTAFAVAALAGCEGAASGALLALIGKATPRESVGAVMGATGSAASLGALVLPLLLTAVDRLSDSHSAAWIALAGVLFAVAWYVRTHGLRVGLGLPVRLEPEPAETAMTVTVVGDADAMVGAPAVVTRLAELAAHDELVVVYGEDADDVDPTARGRTNVLVAGLRYRLPRHTVVAVDVRRQGWPRPRLAAMLSEFVEAGAVAVAVIPRADVRGTAAELSSYLGADRVMAMSYSRTQGAHLHEVWRRALPAPAGGGDPP